MATHEMTSHAQDVNSFLHEFKIFLLAILLASHECAPFLEVLLGLLFQNSKLKTTPLLTKLQY